MPQYSAPDKLAQEIESYDPTKNPFAATAKEQISRRLPSPPTQPLVHPYQVSHQSIMAQNPVLVQQNPLTQHQPTPMPAQQPKQPQPQSKQPQLQPQKLQPQPQQVQQKFQQQQQQKPVPQPQMIQPDKELAQSIQLAEMHDTAFLEEKGMKIRAIRDLPNKPLGIPH